MGSIIGTTSLCVPGLLSPISQKREQETNEYLSPKMMDQKVYGRMHTVEFLLVSRARMMEGLHDFHSRRGMTSTLQLGSGLSALELANEAVFV